MDGDKSTRDIYDASEGEYDNAWKWTAVNGRGGEDREEEFAYTLSPRVFFFEEGRHSITFEGQEEGTRLDSILMTNDPWFDPRSAETSPAPTGLQVLAEGLVSLEWITMPGRSYQVAMKTTAGETDWTLLTDIMTATTTREQYVFLVTAPSGFYSLLMLP
jgi:hypothetical protein